MADNADVLAEHQIAKNFRFGGFVATLAFGVAAPFITNSIPKGLVSALITFVIYFFCKRLYEDRIKVHLLLGGKRRRWLRVAGICFVSLLLTIAFISLPVLLVSHYF